MNEEANKQINSISICIASPFMDLISLKHGSTAVLYIQQILPERKSLKSVKYIWFSSKQKTTQDLQYRRC